MSRTTRMYAVALIIGCGIALFAAPQLAHTASPAQGGRIQPKCQTVQACHRALAWQIKDRHHLRVALSYKRHADAMRSLKLAAAAFHVPLADEVCIATHESGLGNQSNPEPGSSAVGLMQFIPSTWSHTPFAAFGFSPWDNDANALAAAQIVAHDGGWHQWSTRGICGL